MRGGSSVAGEAAGLVAEGYERYRERFDRITAQAPVRFARREWAGAQLDALNRLLLGGHQIGCTLERLQQLPGPAPRDGARLKQAYAEWSAARPDADIARTFFNSVVRRLLQVQGVDPTVEFAGDELDPQVGGAPPVRRYAAEGGVLPLQAMLEHAPLARAPGSPAEDAALATALLEREFANTPRVLHADVLEPLFYRNKGAYLVARVQHADGTTRPLVLALRNDEGVRLDALLPTEDETSIVFSFTHSYFQVAVENPRPVVDFLRAIMPQKPRDELYTSLGFNRHGKAELYRALMDHLADGRGRLEPAPGARGLVMAVFMLPSLNVVFKVIRDRFGQPKRTSARLVRERYQLVFTSDRVGRLADAQEFENLALPRACFADEVLDELLRECAATVRLEGDSVVIAHAYTERRVTPLNLYLQQAEAGNARHAILDYGQAVRDLAAANIFPGDMLLKNFGVTRHGRVIFYDYDEVVHLTDCNIRDLPEPPSELEAMAATPWYSVRDEDVFPEEFAPFMVPPGPFGDAFRAAHGELFTSAFWRGMQERHRQGELVDFYPYDAERRLRPE